MAIIHCPECNKEISSNTRICPNYGFKLFNVTTWWGAIFAVLVVFIGSGNLMNKYTDLPQPYLIALIASIVLVFYGYNARRQPD